MRYATPHQVGRESELRVKAVLKALVAEGVLRGFRHTRWHSKDDMNGIDFFLFTDTCRIPLQVKASRYGMMMHEAYTFRTKIDCVVGFWSDDKLREKILEIIKKFGGLADGHTAG